MEFFQNKPGLERVVQPLFDTSPIGGEPVMRTVRVKRDELLEKVKKNRGEHEKILREAREGYRIALIAALQERIEQAREGKEISHEFDLEEPCDHRSEYDVAIAKLEWSQDETWELDHREFMCLVMDRWEWRHQFLRANAAYSQTAHQLFRAGEG